MGIRIIVAEDHRITREGLVSMLKEEPDIEVVGEAKNGREAVRLARELTPDLVIMDVTMPDLNGIDATRMIRDENKKTRVVALSMYSDKQFVQGMMQAGATGYLLKDCAFEELIKAIRAALSGQTYLSPDIAGIVVQDYLNKLAAENQSAASILTKREREVLQLIAEGNKTKVIASRLNVSVKTVETHRRQIMEKLRIYSIAGLTKFAIREGLTSLYT
ncbi:MAG: response regulator transcription factor [Deltaproteobacteria bacterium]|nr:response regulator transcription factor [Deltaproteobacteria bacterium]MBW2139170.1 response regulator transcription factor [Deltaproteobacteria bacterium]